MGHRQVIPANILVAVKSTTDYVCPYCGCDKPHQRISEFERFDVQWQCAESGCLQKFYGQSCPRIVGRPATGLLLSNVLFAKSDGILRCGGRRGSKIETAIHRDVFICSKCGRKFLVSPCLEIPYFYSPPFRLLLPPGRS